MYAKLTDQQKQALVVEYNRARELGACDVLHAVAIAAHNESILIGGIGGACEAL
jgi:hypothetical protein